MADLRVADPRWRLTWCIGPDAVSFLQGLLSADLAVDPGTAVRSFLLHPQGKVEAMLRVLVDGDRVGLVSDASVADAVVATLSRYRIRVKAAFEVDERPVRVLVDEPADVANGWEEAEGALRADALLRGSESTLVVGVPPQGTQMAPEEWDAWRIVHAEPITGVDVDASTIPQETGLVDDSVSFTKGCYLGQELVARIDSRGRVNQRLVVVTAAGVIAPGDVVAGAEREAPVTSAASLRGEWVGLAMVRREVPNGASVVVRTAEGDVAATVREP